MQDHGSPGMESCCPFRNKFETASQRTCGAHGERDNIAAHAVEEEVAVDVQPIPRVQVVFERDVLLTFHHDPRRAHLDIHPPASGTLPKHQAFS